MLFGHGDDFTQLPLRGNFSSNVWYGANVEELRAHLFREFTRLTRYPEPDAASLKCVLADSCGISSENIVVTNGSITAFYLIAQAWAGATSTILVPSFVMIFRSLNYRCPVRICVGFVIRTTPMGVAGRVLNYSICFIPIREPALSWIKPIANLSKKKG